MNGLPAVLPKEKKNPWRLEQRRQRNGNPGMKRQTQAFSKTSTGVRCFQEIHRRVCRHSKEGKEDLPPSSSLAFTEIKETLIGKSCSDSVTEHSVLLSAFPSLFLWGVVVVVVVVVCALPHYLCCFLSPFSSLSFIHPTTERLIIPQAFSQAFLPSPALSLRLPKGRSRLPLTPPHTHTGLLLLFAALHCGPLWIYRAESLDHTLCPSSTPTYI